MKNFFAAVRIFLWMWPLVLVCDPISAALVSIEANADSQLFQDIIENQLADLRTGALEKAYRDFTSSQFREATSFDEYKQFINRSPVFLKNRSFQFHSQYIHDGISSLQGALISEEGQVLQVEYDFVQEDGKWKILGIQLFKPNLLSMNGSGSNSFPLGARKNKGVIFSNMTLLFSEPRVRVSREKIISNPTAFIGSKLGFNPESGVFPSRSSR